VRSEREVSHSGSRARTSLGQCAFRSFEIVKKQSTKSDYVLLITFALRPECPCKEDLGSKL
jgi:hypothetical protein